MLKKRKQIYEIKQYVLKILIILFSTALTVCAGFIRDTSFAEILRNVIVSIMSAGGIVLCIDLSYEKDGFLYENAEHPERFFVFYMMGIVLAAVFPLLPAKAWPIMVIAVCMTLSSNFTIGIMAYFHLVLMAILINGADIQTFFVYLLSGMIACVLFKDLDVEFRFGTPLLVSCLLLFVSETAFLVLFDTAKISLDSFVFPMFNFVVCYVLLLIYLNQLSKKVIHKYRDIYQILTDTEHPLLMELRQTDRSSYHRAVHTAYLSDKIARKLGCDSMLAKAGGYYYKIARQKKGTDTEEFTKLAEEYSFPQKLTDILSECMNKKIGIRSKETAIIILSDAVVSAITFLFEKDKNAVLNYEQIIDVVFKKKMEDGSLAKCDLTFSQFTMMKHFFGEEKLYYDFLR